MTNRLRSEAIAGARPSSGVRHLTLPTIWLALILFVSRGLLHLLVVPMWEGFDEPFHYAYLQYIAEHRMLPPLNAPSVSQEILKSLQLFPTTSHLSHFAPMRFKDFWDLGAADRVRLRQSLDSIEPAAKYQLANLPNYQTQHPPLYYVLCIPVYMISRHLPLVDRVFLLRAFSLLLAAFSLPLGYALARRIFNDSWATLVPVFMALFPNYYVFVGRITNDAAAVVLFPLLIIATGRLHEKPITPRRLLFIGFLLGLGLLTKVYFVTAVPVLLMTIMIKRFRGEISSRLCTLAVSLVLMPAILLAGWWYLRNYMELGTLFGLAQTRMSSSLPLIASLKGLLHLRLGEFLKLLFQLHLWAGNWSFRMVSKTFYHLFEVVYALCAVGLIRSLLRNHSMLDLESDQNRESGRSLIIPIGFLMSFLAGMFYHRWTASVAGLFIDRQWFGALGSEGWYLNVLLPVEGILLFLGVQGLVALRGARVASVTLLGLFFALDQVALWSREIPYYAGLSIRVAHPFADSAHTVQQVVASLVLAFRRVAFLGPHWSSAGLLLSSILLTLSVTAATFVFVHRCLSHTPPTSTAQE